MSKASNKMQISIYQINGEHKMEQENWNDLINRIVPKTPDYKEQGIKNATYNNYKVRLFVCNDEEYTPKKVISFYGSIVKQGESLYQTKKRDVSTIMFVYNDSNMFAMTTGFAYSIIRNYIDMEFGLKIMSGLISEYDSIKSISDKGVVGSIIANTRYFRGSYNWNDEDDFGKLFKEVCAQLPRRVFVDKLGFDEDDAKKDITCIGKTSFKINKTITIEKLFEIVSKFEEILKDSKNVFNSMLPIYNKGSDKEKYSTLTNALIEHIFQCVSNGYEIAFDISNSEFDTFYKADSYNVLYDNKRVYEDNIESIEPFDFFKKIQEQDILSMETLDDFKDTFSNIRICSYSPEGIELTNDTLLNHINGEFRVNEKTYFILDGVWLELKDVFVTRLNHECKNYLSKYYVEGVSSVKWENGNTMDENSFIDLLCSQEGHYKIHPVKTSEQLELCDSIKIDNNDTYMFFVKDGFDHCIRDLTSQVYISCRRLTELRKSGETSLIEDYYDRVYSKYGNESLDKISFVKAFCENELIAVVAFRPKTHFGNIVKRNPEVFDSNIAKYSLVTSVKDFNVKLDYKLMLHEIKTKNMEKNND